MVGVCHKVVEKLCKVTLRSSSFFDVINAFSFNVVDKLYTKCKKRHFSPFFDLELILISGIISALWNTFYNPMSTKLN